MFYYGMMGRDIGLKSRWCKAYIPPDPNGFHSQDCIILLGSGKISHFEIQNHEILVTGIALMKRLADALDSTLRKTAHLS